MFQRLIAIPQEEYMQLKTLQQVRQPLTQQFNDLEKRYQEGEYIAEPYKRLAQQSELLDEMQDLKVKMRQSIAETSPKAYQSRAKTLFQNLEPFLKFNERGEIYNTENQLVSHSRLEDLVQHAVRDRRRSMTPTGWPDFRRLLLEHNVPKFMLNRDTLDEMSEDETKTVVKPVKTEVKEEHKSRSKSKSKIKSRPLRSRKPNPKFANFLQNF